MEVVRVLLERKVFKTFDTGMLLSLASLKGGVSAGLLRPLRRYASLLRSRAIASAWTVSSQHATAAKKSRLLRVGWTVSRSTRHSSKDSVAERQ